MKDKGHKLYSCKIDVNYEGCISLTKSNIETPAHKTFTRFDIWLSPKRIILIDNSEGIIGKNKKGQLIIRKTILDVCEFQPSMQLDVFEYQIHLTSL